MPPVTLDESSNLGLRALLGAVVMADIEIDDIAVASSLVAVCESIASDPLGVLSRALCVPHERGRVLIVEHRTLLGPKLHSLELDPGTLSMPNEEMAVWQFSWSSPAERGPSRCGAVVEFTPRGGSTQQLSMCLTMTTATSVGRVRRRRCESLAKDFAEALAQQL